MSRQYGSPWSRRLVGLFVVSTFVASACSGGNTGDPDTTAASVSSAPSPESSGQVEDATSAASVETTPRPAADDPGASGSLGEVCPSTVSIQTASLPDPSVGPLYLLLGPDPVIDVSAQTVSAPLAGVEGADGSVTLAVRSGGPAVGFRTAIDLLAADPDLLLAQASTAVALREQAGAASIGVVTLTDRSSEALIVDPGTYPDVDTVDEVRDAAIEVRHVTDEPFIAYLEWAGSLAPGQLVAGFDGEPAAFVQSGGAVSQQGDLLVEPALLPSLPQWSRPVTAIAAASAGWAVHDDALVVRPGDVEGEADCLAVLVPVIQRAIAAYIAEPAPTNALMSDVRFRFAPLARLTPELMDAGVATGRDAGVFGDGTNDTVGDFDVERLSPFLPDLAAALDVEPVGVDALMTNEFIDPTITSAG